MSEPGTTATSPVPKSAAELEKELKDEEQKLEAHRHALLITRLEKTRQLTEQAIREKEATEAQLSKAKNEEKEAKKKDKEEEKKDAEKRKATEEKKEDDPLTESRLKKLIAEAQLASGSFSHTFTTPTSRIAATFAKEIMAMANNINEGEKIAAKAKQFYFKLVMMAENPMADRMIEQAEAQAELTGAPLATILQASAPLFAQSFAKKPRYARYGTTAPFGQQPSSSGRCHICNGLGHFAAACPNTYGPQPRRRYGHITPLNQLK